MILVCGEALIDFFPPAAEGRGTLEFSGRAGGSPFNVAVGLARLGIPAAFYSSLSTDLFGTALRQTLLDEGVDLSLVCMSRQPSTLAFVQTGPDANPRYAFMGDNAADRQVSVETLPASLPDDIRALSFGSFSLAVEPCGTAYETLMRREAPHRVIALDPNVRSSLIPDMEKYRQRLERLVGLSNIVKVSTEDLCELYGADTNITDVGGRWFQHGPSLVVITDGAKGVHVLLDGKRTFFPARTVVVTDTVGAGDSFHAALLAGLYRTGYLTQDAFPSLRHEELAPVIEQAIAAASVTCTRQGADLPYLIDLFPQENGLT